MEQLSGLDAAFVHQDSRRTPMHITAVLIYDTGKGGCDRIDLARLRHLVNGTLRQFPVFHRRLRRIAMDVDTPYWVDAPGPDLRHHITRSALPGACNWPGLLRHLAELHRRRLDLSKPLWEFHLLEDLLELQGLPPRCQALVIKIHHSAIDGISLARIIEALHAESQAPEHRLAGAELAPGYWDIWARLNLNSIGRQLKLAETLGDLVPAVLRARKSRRQFDDLPPVAVV